MPPPNPPTNANGPPATAGPDQQDGGNNATPARGAKDERRHIKQLLPLTFSTLLSFHQLSRPLMILTILSVLPAVRSRFIFAWQGSIIPWKTMSNRLWWAALSSWLSGQSLYVLTLAACLWWPARRREEGTAQP